MEIMLRLRFETDMPAGDQILYFSVYFSVIFLFINLFIILKQTLAHTSFHCLSSKLRTSKWLALCINIHESVNSNIFEL